MYEFDLLDERLRACLAERGIAEPTEPQRLAIPAVLSGDHLLLVAPTGIGKTEAAMLPILQMLSVEERGGIRCVYVTPLRALNRDLLARLHELCEAVGLRAAVRHGDTTQSERTAQSKDPPDVMITTPETLQIMFTGKNLRRHLTRVRHVVVDEIHELAEDERGAQLSVALERLVELAGEYQRIGLSATVGSIDEIGNYLAGRDRAVNTLKISAVKDMRISVESPPEEDVDQAAANRLQTDAKHFACMKRCRDLVEAHKSTLFFVNTRDYAEALGVRYHLWGDQLSIGVHHGSLSRDVRVQMEDDFKSQRLKALICTSSLELGIDVGSADYTIQFNSPRQVTRLIQRVGRSGHRHDAVSYGTVINTDAVETAESLVIARRAAVEELEKFTIRENPLGVLANQLVAMTLTDSRIDKDWAYAVITRAHPFRRLLRADFEEVLKLLAELHVLWNDEDSFRRKTTGRRYFYDNISMIPDERTYRIREVSTRGVIGTLDESFVASYAEPYATFVARGRTWRIVEVGEDEVLVEEVREIGATPSWVGEEIPVPYEIAQEVGAMRRLLELDVYPGDEHAREVVASFVKAQGDFPLPTDKRVTIEQGDGVIVINCCFGSKVNETLSKLITSLLIARFGESIGVQTEPYHIVLETPRNLTAKDVLRTIQETDPDSLHQLMRIVLGNSSYLRWQFLHIAKKFGAVRKDADYKMLNISKLMEAFEHTPMVEEAVVKTLDENMDIETAAAVLHRIHQGSIEVVVGPLSPIGQKAIGKRQELMQPRRADKAVLMALKKRLMSEDVVLVCMNCRVRRKGTVGGLPERVKCESCGGVVIAAVRPYARRDLAVLKKGASDEEELKALRRIYKNANLVMAHGRKAVIALVGRGIGPDTAARILARYHLEEQEFLKDILEAEVNYARTKRFWD
ncbi:MAG: DEAD/DEAH box helicase [Methanobacteriota archaeon]|nr:MAG: DEAD/DEAH box helicase [Euryarchaeota archaeon]